MDGVSRWRYRCEGNRNVVVADTERRVIRRILKSAPAKEAARQPKACGSELSNNGEAACNGSLHAAPETASAAAGAAAATDEQAAAAADQEKVAKEVIAIARYYVNVMKPLLQCYAVVPVPVVVESQFIEQALQTCSSLRPDHRKESSVHSTTVCLELPDLCYLPDTNGHRSDEYPTFAVEVKLKSGVCSLRTPGTGQSACLPCALYKHCKTNGVVTGCRASDQPYCPVDLFSGDRKRMMFALQTSLRDCRLGTNRMRVFKNGVYLNFAGQETWSTERYLAALDEQLAPFFSSASGTRCEALLQLVIDALLTPNGKLLADADDSAPPAMESGGGCVRRDRCSLSLFPGGEAVAPAEAPASAAATIGMNGSSSPCRRDSRGADDDDRGSGLPRGCVLDRVLAAQTLSSECVEVVYRDCFLPLVDYLNENPAVAERLFSYEHPYWDVRTSDPQLPQVDCEEKVVGYFVQVRNFLISKTASDCSAMITLKPMGSADRLLTETSPQQSGGRAMTILSDSTGMAYRCSMHVIDLDPKPLRKLPVYMDAYGQCMKALSVEAQPT